MKRLVTRLIVIFLFILFLFIICSRPMKSVSSENFNWNNGYCELDGGRLDYISVSSKYHYKCEICGKEYRFDKVMPRK